MREISADTTVDQKLLSELLTANRELAAVNREIATSLANLEKLYREDIQTRNEFSRASMRRVRKMMGRSSTWGLYVPFILIGAIVALTIGLPQLMKLFQ